MALTTVTMWPMVAFSTTLASYSGKSNTGRLSFSSDSITVTMQVDVLRLAGSGAWSNAAILRLYSGVLSKSSPGNAKRSPYAVFIQVCVNIPYGQKIWRGIKFGGLAVYFNNRQIKIRQNFLLAYPQYIRMAIPYRTAKLKSVNTFAMAIWDRTTKFNSRQYFRLYGIIQ